MSIRPTQQATFTQIQRGLLSNFSALVRSQEQISSGKRIVRPSDDPVGASQALAFRRQIASAERNTTAVEGAQVMLDTAAGLLQDAGGLLAEARASLLQGMNGTASADDRKLLANSISLIRDRLLEIGNARAGNRYLFAGTATDTSPFSATANGVRYLGNEEAQEVLVGIDARLATTVPGDEIFAAEQRNGTRFSGLTGLASGTTADQGTGYVHIRVRHDATSASGLGGGVTLGSSAADTLVGSHALVVDGTARTVRLGNGELVALPTTLGPVVVRGEHGAEVNLDFSAWDGSSFSATVDGSASISIDGSTWRALTLSENDLRLTDPASGTVIHVDTRSLHRAGTELVTFGGTVNVFDVLQGIVADLENAEGLGANAQRDRLNIWLDELDRNHENVLVATGELGALSQRASGLQEAYDGEMTQVRALLSRVEDVDFATAVMEMSRAEQTLQLAQATSARLLQNSLLNFLR
ncbi:MAG: flagellar hook-associated protein 3 [Planctomycetes bacterium]|nr:flagellar hook-associated protein 3 [Planctomycetota bacterium]